MARQGASKHLHKAKKSKSDEFYTQYVDIQKELEAYLEPVFPIAKVEFRN